MKTAAAIIALTLACFAVAMADLVPELLTVSYYRTNAVQTSAVTSFFRGSTLRLTNCVAYASGGAVQDLTDLGIVIKIGDNATNLTASGTAEVATNGTFTADALIPSTGGQFMRVQLRLTNSTTIYIYPELTIAVEAAL